MARSSLRQFSAMQRREGLPWTAALGLIVGALLVNAVGLYATGTALALALEPVDKPEEEQVVQFDLLDASDEPPANEQVANDQRPEQPEQLADEDSQIEPQAQVTNKPDQREAAPRARVRGDDTSEGAGAQTGAGDDSLVAKSDGDISTQGADAGTHQGPPTQVTGLGGSTSMLNDTFGRPPSSDARQRDVDGRAPSMLDNERHLYSSFFNRMADRVREHWRPQKVLDSTDPHGKKYGRSSRTTGLMVRLDAEGNILKLVVVQKSGSPELDQEAVRAIRAAGPFPNMPRGLADANGQVEFPFGFNLLDSGAWNIFRLAQQ